MGSIGPPCGPNCAEPAASMLKPIELRMGRVRVRGQRTTRIGGRSRVLLGARGRAAREVGPPPSPGVEAETGDGEWRPGAERLRPPARDALRLARDGPRTAIQSSRPLARDGALSAAQASAGIVRIGRTALGPPPPARA